MKTSTKANTPTQSDADKRMSRLWRLYVARIGSIDPNRDVRTIDKICRDELKVARTALTVFENAGGQ